MSHGLSLLVDSVAFTWACSRATGLVYKEFWPELMQGLGAIRGLLKSIQPYQDAQTLLGRLIGNMGETDVRAVSCLALCHVS